METRTGRPCQPREPVDEVDQTEPPATRPTIIAKMLMPDDLVPSDIWLDGTFVPLEAALTSDGPRLAGHLDIGGPGARSSQEPPSSVAGGTSAGG